MKSVSVVICAYNSAERIGPTIEALSRCHADFPVEIILVDNNSTDGTAELAAKMWKETGNRRFNFRTLQEPQPGLAYARHAGVRAASGDIIVFCDDDNWLSEDYLMNAIRIMQDPTVGAAGGCSTPTRPERIPPWFYTFSWGFAVGVPLSKIAGLPDPPHTERAVTALWGAGLVVRRNAIEFLYSLPEFPALTGRKGGELLSGEDLEISACLACAGYKLLYSDTLLFQHDIAPERLTANYAKRLFLSFGAGFAALGQYSKTIEAFEHPLRATAVGCGRIMKHILLRRLNRDSFLALFAALRVPWLLTQDQLRIYDTVRRIRAQSAVRTAAVANTRRDAGLETPVERIPDAPALTLGIPISTPDVSRLAPEKSAVSLTCKFAGE